MAEPKISIIIPVYNIENYVERALQSACSQTLADIEIIVIDDASTDNSAAVVERYAKEDTRIVFLRHEKNQKQGAARNTGIHAAKAPYIMFLDGDDFIEKETCEVCYEKITQYQCEMLCFGVNRVEENKIAYVGEYFPTDKVYENYAVFQNFIVSNYWWSPCNKVFDGNVLIKNNIRFPEGVFYEDVPFMLDIAQHIMSMVCVPNVFYNYCLRNFSTSQGLVTFKKIDDAFTSYFSCIGNLRHVQDHGWHIEKLYSNLCKNIEQNINSSVHQNASDFIKYLNEKKRDAGDRFMLFEQASQYYEEQLQAILRSPTFRLGKFFMLPLRMLKLFLLRIVRHRKRVL